MGNNGFGRRDTLKLASAAAALGAGLGVVLRAADALAQPAAPAGQIQEKRPQLPAGLPAQGIQTLKVEPPQQAKIDGYQKLAPQKGQMQLKLHTTNGQLLYAANVPDDIAQLLFQSPALQVTFYRPAMVGATLTSEAFKEGVMQFVPTSPSTSRGGIPDDSIKPKSTPSNSRGGIPDDSIKPKLPPGLPPTKNP